MTPQRSPKIHQVLATLGYGDAIGHEALGIQRVLRNAGFDSEIFVQTADPRLDILLNDTVSFRDLPTALPEILGHMGALCVRIIYPGN